MALHAQAKNNNVPLTGFGGFDLQLVPGGGASVLNVVVSLFFVDSRPGGTAPTLGNFIAAMRANIQNDWNDKFRFQSTAGDEVTLRFVINQAANRGAAHFSVVLNNGGYGVGSGLKFADAVNDPAGVGNGTPYLELQGVDNQPYCVGGHDALATGMINVNRMGLHLAERARVVQQAPNNADGFDIVLDRNGNTWQVAHLSQAGLNQFCTAMTNTPQWLVQPPLVLQSESGLQDKANALVTAVRNYLRGRGVGAQISLDARKVKRKARWPRTAHKDTAVVNIQIESVQEMVKNWASDYVVASHEFGHCLGVPDEYLDYSAMQNQTIKNSQPMWDILCTANGVPTRNWHSSFCESMMSVGKRLYPAHAVPILSVFETMMARAPDNIPPGSWDIVAP